MTNHIAFNPELVKRYDQPGPRYTSYPAANQFNERVDARNYTTWAKQSNEAQSPDRCQEHRTTHQHGRSEGEKRRQNPHVLDLGNWQSVARQPYFYVEPNCQKFRNLPGAIGPANKGKAFQYQT
jgi:hypothetical protein